MKPVNAFGGLWAVLLPMVVAMTLGLLAPQPVRADTGEYQILQARYGTAWRNEDVTQRLKELARNDQNFRITNSTFGIDPAPGEVKVLRIFARARDGRVRTFEYTEKTTVDGSRFTGWGSGNWGQGGGYSGGWDGGDNTGQGPGSGYAGGGQGGGHGGGYGGSGSGQGGGRPGDVGEYQILQARYGTPSRHVDVTARLRELARSDRSFRATNDRFGVDPAPGQVKVLRIFARGRDGRTRTFEYDEKSTVDGAMFTAWSSGNWGNGGWNGGWGDHNKPPFGSGEGYGRLTIVRAMYGVEGRQRDITDRLRQRIADNRLEVRADNNLAGRDPAPNQPKWLWVVYSVDGGRERRTRVAEGDRLSLP